MLTANGKHILILGAVSGKQKVYNMVLSSGATLTIDNIIVLQKFYFLKNNVNVGRCLQPFFFFGKPSSKIWNGD